jgi:aminopeptidase-like protein
LNLYRQLKQAKNNNLSYLFLIVPETLGTFFYIKYAAESLKNISGVVDLETVGAGKELCFKYSLNSGDKINSIFETGLKDLDITYKALDFFGGYGNDERVFNWPALGIPSVSLMRYPFEQYHTSSDIPELINKDYLFQALEICLKFVEILEMNYIPKYNYTLPPWLTKRNLYFDSIYEKSKNLQFNNLLMFNINGVNSVTDLCDISGLKFTEIYDYLEKFCLQKLISKEVTDISK